MSSVSDFLSKDSLQPAQEEDPLWSYTLYDLDEETAAVNVDVVCRTNNFFRSQVEISSMSFKEIKGDCLSYFLGVSDPWTDVDVVDTGLLLLQLFRLGISVISVRQGIPLS